MEEALNMAEAMDDIISKDKVGDWVVNELSPQIQDNGQIAIAIALLVFGAMLTFKGAQWFQSLLFGVCLHRHFPFFHLMHCNHSNHVT